MNKSAVFNMHACKPVQPLIENDVNKDINVTDVLLLFAWTHFWMQTSVCAHASQRNARTCFSKSTHTWITLYKLYLWLCMRSSCFWSMLILSVDPRTLFIMIDKQLTGSSGFFCTGWCGFNGDSLLPSNDLEEQRHTSKYIKFND